MDISIKGNAGAEAYFETLVATLCDILESGCAATNDALIAAHVQLHRSIRIAMGLPVEVASETPGGEPVPTIIYTDLYVEDHYEIIDACLRDVLACAGSDAMEEATVEKLIAFDGQLRRGLGLDGGVKHEAPVQSVLSQAEDPWALGSSFFSIVVKRHAVIRSYAGGPQEFERNFPPARKNGAIFLLSRMSLDDVEAALADLNDAGLVPGRDIAVADLYQGPILPCPGIAFRNHNDDWLPLWTMNIDPSYVEPEQP